MCGNITSLKKLALSGSTFKFPLKSKPSGVRQSKMIKKCASGSIATLWMAQIFNSHHNRRNACSQFHHLNNLIFINISRVFNFIHVY